MFQYLSTSNTADPDLALRVSFLNRTDGRVLEGLHSAVVDVKKGRVDGHVPVKGLLSKRNGKRDFNERGVTVSIRELSTVVLREATSILFMRV